MRFTLALVLLASVLGACAKNDSPTEQNSGASAEYTAMLKAQAATQDAATNSNGLVKGTGLTVSTFVDLVNTPAPLLSAWDPETDCESSGWPDSSLNSSDSGYAFKFLLCSVLKRPNGPDTVRGGFDRITGMLCAIGDISYDGQTRTKDITISTTCFSQSFVTTACTFINGSASDGPCTASAQIMGNANDGSVAPSTFDRYVTMSILDGEVEYTFAHKITSTSVAGACMEGLPTASSSGAAFAFFLDSTAGVLRFEGRFDSNNERHMRINLEGTVSTALAITNVNNLQFVQAENFSDGGSNKSGKYISVSGTPSAGRRFKINDSSDLTAGTIVWSPGADDDECVGETGVTCSGNAGIVPTDTKFFFLSGSGFTTSKTWFGSHSYLGDVSNSVDMNDLWD